MKLQDGEFKIKIECPHCGVSFASIGKTTKKGFSRIAISDDLKIIRSHLATIHGKVFDKLVNQQISQACLSVHPDG